MWKVINNYKVDRILLLLYRVFYALSILLIAFHDFRPIIDSHSVIKRYPEALMILTWGFGILADYILFLAYKDKYLSRRKGPLLHKIISLEQNESVAKIEAFTSMVVTSLLSLYALLLVTACILGERPNLGEILPMLIVPAYIFVLVGFVDLLRWPKNTRKWFLYFYMAVGLVWFLGLTLFHTMEYTIHLKLAVLVVFGIISNTHGYLVKVGIRQ